MAELVQCIDPGQGLGLELGATYEMVRKIDPWTVAVRNVKLPEVDPSYILDTWEHAVWPEAELLSPRAAGRFVALEGGRDG